MASFVVSDQEVNTLPAYQYNPLEGSRYIRLVELFPGKEEEVIHCALRHVSLDSEPNFEALSTSGEIQKMFSTSYVTAVN
jgi:hypothetical protein